jgi:hypothetical protein
MPRKRKTMTGADAQSIDSVEGQRYGEGVEQQQLQETLPAPERGTEIAAPTAAGPSSAPAPGGSPGGPSQGGPPAVAGVDPAAIQQFLASNQPRLLGGTASPDEPITAGLSSGPGAGPEVLAMGRSTTPLARYMRRLAQETGNTKWQHLAERARL